MQRPTNLPSPILIIGQVWQPKESSPQIGALIVHTVTGPRHHPATTRCLGMDSAMRSIELTHNDLLADIAAGAVSDADLKDLTIKDNPDAIMVVAMRQNGYMAWFQLGDDVLLYHSDTLTGLFDTVSRMHRVHAAALLWRRLYGPIAGDDTYEVWKAALIDVLDWVRSHPLSPTAPIISLKESLSRTSIIVAHSEAVTDCDEGECYAAMRDSLKLSEVVLSDHLLGSDPLLIKVREALRHI